MAIKQTEQLERLMQEAFDRKASFLYMIPNEPPVFRIKDKIERGQSEALTVEQVRDIVTAAFGEKDLKDVGSERGQLMTLCTLNGVAEGRMNVTKVNGNYVLSVRMLPANLPDVKQLKIPEAILEAAMMPKGLIIFTGSSGCGKTTSLFSVLDYINANRACAISTIEYSAGYHLTGKQALIQQREVGVDVPDMTTGISISVMQGADVLMIGELRNPEEIEMCIMVSQNLLVLTQLHADLPQEAIQRLVDNLCEESGATARRILAEKLRVVCAQKLLPRTDGKGRTAVYDVLVPDEKLRKAIAEKRDILKRKTTRP
jgi:twitching motility protein PilT